MTTGSLPKVVVVRELRNDLSNALKKGLEQVPTLFPPILPRQVVIKPNLCDIASWETGVTTDPHWLLVLAEQLRAIRSDVHIRVVESDAISAYKNYRSCDETFERLGFAAVAEDVGVELVNLSRAGSIEVRIDNVPYPVRIPELFLEELYFISIANLKVHPYTRMTGVLKNLLGLLTDADISYFHPYLSFLISGLHRLFTADLCIIDGRIGLEGQGPIIGFPVRMDTILFGNDALAVDETACDLMGIKPNDVPHLCQTRKDLRRSFRQFEISGEVRVRPFAFQAQYTHRAILGKFASRRFYQRMDAFTSRWIDRSVRIQQDPLTFTKSAIRRLLRSRRAQ